MVLRTLLVTPLYDGCYTNLSRDRTQTPKIQSPCQTDFEITSAPPPDNLQSSPFTSPLPRLDTLFHFHLNELIQLDPPRLASDIRRIVVLCAFFVLIPIIESGPTSKGVL